MAKHITTIIPDASIIIEGILSKSLEKKEITTEEIILHESSLSIFQNLAKQNRAKGFFAIEEIQRLQSLSRELGFSVRFSGMRLSNAELQRITLNELDNLIIQIAFDSGGTLYTVDQVLANIAEARGMEFVHLSLKEKIPKLKLDKYFDNTTMSVHLKENLLPSAKKGTPGSWELLTIGKSKLSRDKIQEISREIIEAASISKDGFIEIEREGSTIIQLGNYRIVITKPPFSDNWEITAVRPVKKLDLNDYQLSEKLTDRISGKAEGILIAGSPGMGKSTFAQALTEHYASGGKIVKTVEAPRDLILSDNVTQYAISHGNSSEIHDILLLSRPDYTIFDEMRNTDDFGLYSDLRLAGIGLAGVVHATNPIDAIQRFVGRLELGVIPHVIDTVVFIKDGGVDTVLSLEMTVKVPSGMTESDLARPVVSVRDFETGKSEFELYSYGEETVVIPVKEEKQSSVYKYAAATLEKEFAKYSRNAKVEVIDEHKCVVYVPEENISKLIGKQGQTISELEKRLGIGIDVRPLDEVKQRDTGDSLEFDFKATKKGLDLYFNPEITNTAVDIFVEGDYLMSVQVGKAGKVKLKRNSTIVKVLFDALNAHKQVEAKEQS